MSLSMQETFDTVVTHLHTQGSPAEITKVNDYGDVRRVCLYLTEDGRKCAIGCLIPDGHTAQRCDGDVEGLLEEHPALFDVLVPFDGREESGLVVRIDEAPTPTGVLLLDRLQQLHDAEGNWRDNGFAGWARAREIARRHHLNTSVVDALEAL